MIGIFFISAVEGGHDSKGMTEDTDLTCTKRAAKSCAMHGPSNDYHYRGTRSSPPMTTSKEPSASPSPSPLTTTVQTTALPSNEVNITTTNEPPSSTQDRQTVDSEENRNDVVMATSPPTGSGLMITISPLVIAFIVLGAFLFVILIILVFVLIFCLRRKGGPSQQNIRKPRGRQLTHVESAGEFMHTCCDLCVEFFVMSWVCRGFI